MLYTSMIKPIASPTEPIVAIRLSGPKPVLSEYVYIRRVIPFRPRKNSGRNATLKLIAIVQKAALP
ncbi:hypothetical protein D3C78_1741050 [compost metagenome]